MQHSEEDGRRGLTQRGPEVTEPPVVAPPLSALRKKKGGDKEKTKGSSWLEFILFDVFFELTFLVMAPLALVGLVWVLCFGKKPKKKRRRKKTPKPTGEQPS